MLLLACALAAVAALGALADRGLESQDARASDVAAVSEAPGNASRGGDRAALPAGHPFSQARLIAPLGERLPRLAALLVPEAPLLEEAQIVSYYGNPYTADLGVLGAADLDTVTAQLEAQATRYDQLNGETRVIPALHLVYAVAQGQPTPNGRFLQYTDEATVDRFIAFTRERGLLLFLDLQIGHGAIDEELRQVLPYLRNPQVHLALDPEFAMAPGQVPGVDLGSLPAADINRAQEVLRDLVREERLPPKLLIVHQFTDSMVPDGWAIQRYANVELIIDMDGFGPAAIKRVTYLRYALRPYATNAALKLFFQYDPDLMSEEEVLSLEPRPRVIIYQ
ncbi:MAG: hypothetical protein WEE64_01120 [Dehalococcoidia bacterium]